MCIARTSEAKGHRGHPFEVEKGAEGWKDNLSVPNRIESEGRAPTHPFDRLLYIVHQVLPAGHLERPRSLQKKRRVCSLKRTKVVRSRAIITRKPTEVRQQATSSKSCQEWVSSISLRVTKNRCKQGGNVLNPEKWRLKPLLCAPTALKTVANQEQSGAMRSVGGSKPVRGPQCTHQYDGSILQGVLHRTQPVPHGILDLSDRVVIRPCEYSAKASQWESTMVLLNENIFLSQPCAKLQSPPRNALTPTWECNGMVLKNQYIRSPDLVPKTKAPSVLTEHSSLDVPSVAAAGLGRTESAVTFDEDGARVRVLDVLHEGVLLLAQYVLIHQPRIAQHVRRQVVHRVYRLAPARQHQPLHVAPLRPPQAHDLAAERTKHECKERVVWDQREVAVRS